MAVIVRHKERDAEYILLGAGLGAWRSMRPGIFFGNLAPHDESGTIEAVLVCNSQGVVVWIPSEDLEVVSIDGATPAELLDQDTQDLAEADTDPPSN